MAQGTIKFWNETKGFGFIHQEAGPDIFLHFAALSGSGLRTVFEGDKVEFTITAGAKGPQAENVRKLP